MAQVLAKSGYRVFVLEWDRDPASKQAMFATSISSIKVKMTTPYGPRAALKLALWWGFISSYVLLHQFNVVQPQNLDNLFPISFICRIKRTKVIYDIADFYSEAFIPLSLSVLQRLVSKIERILIKTTNFSLIVDESRYKQIGAIETPIKVIYNSPSEEVLNNLQRKDLIAVNQKFTVFYAGILSEDRGLRSLVQAVKGLDDIELVVAGFGNIEAEFVQLIKGIPNIRFLGRVTYEKVISISLACDCIVALYDPKVPNNVYASPNKLFEAMMCGKPIIVSLGTSMANIVAEEKCGIGVPYNNITEIKAAIKRLKNNQGFASFLGGNGRAAYRRKYNWKRMEKTLLDLYKSNVSTPRECNTE